MKKRRGPVWKGILAALSLSLLMTMSSASVFADENNTSSVTEQGATSVAESAAQSETSNADASASKEGTLSTESTANEAAVSENSTENNANVEETPSANAASGETESETPIVSESVGTTNMFRFYNPNSGEHFYTSSTNEGLYLRNHGWKYEGVGWVAPVSSGSPVYRLYNKNAGDHHYTTATKERDYLVSVGWTYEGIGWYSDDNQTVPIYRQYNPNAKAGAHNYTSAQNEANYLIKNGWRNENIGWYAAAPGRTGNGVEDIGAVTTYDGIDFSPIYDYNYYLSDNEDLSSMSGDDEKLLQHFATSGIMENRQAKAGVSPSSSEYQKIKKQVEAKTGSEDMKIANTYDSNTNYLILVNRNAHRVYIYQGNGKKGNWKKIKEWPCGDGKPSTPTPEGVFMIYGHAYMFGDGSHEFYASFFYKSYYFHSVIYSPAATTPDPKYMTDGTLGAGVSHGCVRLTADNAKWIYDNIPMNTTVVVTHW